MSRTLITLTLVLTTVACGSSPQKLTKAPQPAKPALVHTGEPVKFDLTVELTRITFPYLVCISLVSLMGGVLNSLGKFAAQSLLRTVEPITRIRGREFPYRDAILMPTYHPAYLLRNPSAKRDVWEDMKRVRAILNGQ